MMMDFLAGPNTIEPSEWNGMDGAGGDEMDGCYVRRTEGAVQVVRRRRLCR